MSFAKISLLGNLGKDATSQYTPSGKHNLKFSVAVSRKRGDEETTTWFNCTAWGQLAETMERLGALTKGQQVFVSGRLEPRDWERDGVQRMSLDVTCDSIDLIGGRREQGASESVPF